MVASKGKVKRSAAGAAAEESGKKKKKTALKRKPEATAAVAEDAELGDEGVAVQTTTEAPAPAPKKARKAAGKRPRAAEDALAAGADEVPVAGGAGTSPEPRAKSEAEQTVVYVGRLPPGFEERALRGFFEQFGTVKAVVLGRSPRTGGSQHFGFVEFERADVAHIAAAAMNGYYMEGRRLEVAMADPRVGGLQERLPAGTHIVCRDGTVKRVDTRPRHAPAHHSETVNAALSRRVAEAQTDEGRERLARRIRRDQARRAAKLARAGITDFKIPEPKEVAH